jgi:hypothetical protein
MPKRSKKNPAVQVRRASSALQQLLALCGTYFEGSDDAPRALKLINMIDEGLLAAAVALAKV